MGLKNHSSKSSNTFDKIQKLLATHGAKRVMFDYAQDGRIIALAFILEINGTEFPLQMPARLENVSRVMYGCLLSELGAGYGGDKKRDQVYRTAWANIRDWLDAQMALLDTQMVKIEEIFLPYFVQGNGKTIYENVVNNPKFLLGNGK